MFFTSLNIELVVVSGCSLQGTMEVVTLDHLNSEQDLEGYSSSATINARKATSISSLWRCASPVHSTTYLIELWAAESVAFIG